jgi:hypothetical protein
MAGGGLVGVWLLVPASVRGPTLWCGVLVAIGAPATLATVLSNGRGNRYNWGRISAIKSM